MRKLIFCVAGISVERNYYFCNQKCQVVLHDHDICNCILPIQHLLHTTQHNSCTPLTPNPSSDCGSLTNLILNDNGFTRALFTCCSRPAVLF